MAIPETSSSCVTEGFTAAHNFKVSNFPLLQGMGIGQFVSSRNFSVGGCSWNIRLYPDGDAAEEAKGHVSAFLSPQGGQGEEGVRVKFTLTALGKDGNVASQKSTDHTIDESIGGWGWLKFMDEPTLQSLLRSNNKGFTIRCVVTVIKAPRIEDVRSIVVPESNVLQHFAGMLEDMETADVTFTVGGEVFAAHGCVLAARSPVFRAEIFGPAMKEKATRRVEVEDMEPSIFRALLHFVYTDSLPEDAGDGNVPMQHLLVAADRYGLDRLRLLCEVKMCDGIDVETVSTTLALAEQHRCVQLKKACLQFIASGGVLAAVKGSNGFKHLAASCPSVVLEILDEISSLGV
ncbi:hypothetical protein HU200_064235 [Digitaria exilis]|uniref:Uncharacterized protein n=1 Tax=Digitaria exilis TaxID=1010633 RepID=A0A835AC48_9POAL|nr:hypothetical protein HU200_064235 [Digitaria exilis]CAB3485820.1 unnamed protein product [Digitaria exilis]